jgi:fructose-1,6-bisphosphatase I
MFKAIPTLTDHILEDQQKHKHVTTGLHIVLLQIQNTAKIIASHVKASGLVDIVGKTGNINTFGDEVQKLDEFANRLLIDRLLGSGYVHAIVSEEEDKPRYAPKHLTGNYIVYFDPLDGSQNIDVDMPIGTIFSIYHKKDGLLQKGTKQVAAGYILYSTSVIFVYTTGHGVNGFTLDPAVGSFLLSHSDIQIPNTSFIFSINEGYAEMYDPKIKRYLQTLKDEKKFKGRFAGALVADAHRILIKGGIFLYPVNTNNPKGKLRLTIEVNPFAMLTEQAGGIAVDEAGKRSLLAEPKTIHETASFIMGSKKNVEQFLKSIKK